MLEKEATEIACDFARQNGLETDLYIKRPKKVAGRWDISFQRISENYKPAPGDFFDILIDDKTKEVQKIVYGK